jgi:hypothetical protein
MAIAWTQNHNGFEGTQTNYRIMSDVWGSADWAIVWDEATSSPKHILVNVYDMNPEGWRPVQITVDATPEIREKHTQWLINREYERLLDGATQSSKIIHKGAIAKVVKGKTGKGTVGQVVVVMDGSYGMGWKAVPMKKYAIATSDVKIKKALRTGKVAEVYQVVWAWACNVERVDTQEINQHMLWLEAEKRVLRTHRAA